MLFLNEREGGGLRILWSARRREEDARKTFWAASPNRIYG